MSKFDKLDVNQLLLKGYQKGIKYAIELAIKTKTSLIVEKNNKIVAIKPKFKYIKVPINFVQKKPPTSSKKKTKLKP